MKPIESTEKHYIESGSLAEVGVEVDKFVAQIREPYTLVDIGLDAEVVRVRNYGGDLYRTSLRYSAVVTIERTGLDKTTTM